MCLVGLFVRNQEDVHVGLDVAGDAVSLCAGGVESI